MNRLYYTLIFTVILSYSGISQQVEYAKEIIDTLSSEYFAGRGYVDEGIEKSAEYLVEEYKRIGLKPFNNSYKQDFEVSVNTFPGNMKVMLDDQKLLAGKDYLVDPVSSGIRGEFYVFSVSTKNLTNTKKLKKISSQVEGKFLLIDTRDKPPKDKEQLKEQADIINFLKYNPDLKSVGTIVQSHDKLMWNLAPFSVTKPVIWLNGDVESKKTEVITLNIDAEFKKNYTCSNICGYIEGSEHPDSFIVITAHYDHLGKMGSDIYFPGANDNASGVAMLLNLAKSFVDIKPKYSMIFISLTAEELGLIGAKHFTENPLIKLERIKFLLNFDLAGTGNEGIKVVNATVFPDKFELLSNINNKANLLPAVKKRGEACNSDHCMFYKEGVPSFYIYTLGGSKAYHDIYDRKTNLPLDYFQNYHKLMVTFITSL